VLIINADDWGRSAPETDAALICHQSQRITSVSAMVFMADSERAAKLSKENAVDDVGLHLNFSERYTGHIPARWAADAHARIARFMVASKYAVVFYHPFLRNCFRDVYRTQLEEFVRLYGKSPSHIDGHQHRHLCANMVIDGIIPAGQVVRRNFSFWPGEKGLLNRTYRKLVDKWLGRRYRLTDFFFSLKRCLREQQLARMASLAQSRNVEVMAHPIDSYEYDWLLSDSHQDTVSHVQKGSFARL
jgi:predicted glycoside hydrolase/deacetylase ChbG (UPF0249 family)